MSTSAVLYTAAVFANVDELKPFGISVSLVRIAVLLAVGVTLEVATRVFIPRVTARIAERTSQTMDLERHQRSATVVKFSTSVVRAVLWIIVFVSVLGEININIGPLLAGAGVLGAALAFGAQNIIKDYLAGFFILLENQYTLGDYVKIGQLAGSVEEITMRITVLRGIDGAMHVIPNGTIQSVSNMTSVWARVVIDVAVAYESRFDAAMAALVRAGKALEDDEGLRGVLLEKPEVLGLQSLTETAMKFRVQVRVVPELQWRVQ
ncbi:MAG TPA: mechanosensitive ion channel family protein, partial [Polyangiaceae bacterium]|nr:mechanosensitive ion channel family protein [Polyangiaceae bacterium]